MKTSFGALCTFVDEEKAMISRDRPSEAVYACIKRTDTYGTFVDGEKALSYRDRPSEAVYICILGIGTHGTFMDEHKALSSCIYCV